jgi:ABC-type sugar transport system ATPase subunit
VLDCGHIIQVGTPEDIYDRPANTFVAQLVGTPKINLVEARRQDGMLHVAGSDIHLPVDTRSAGFPESLVLGIRPEDVRVGPDGEFGGQIVLSEPLGAETILHVRSGDQTLLSVVPGLAGLGIGDNVRFDAVRSRLHYFGADGARIQGQ